MNITSKLLFVTCLLLIQHSYAQITINPSLLNKKVTVNGSIVNGKGEPIPYANIIFVNLKTEKKVGVVSSEDGGKFSVELDTGDYILEVSVLGYSKYIKRYALTSDIKIPDIILKDQNEQLDEVVIRAELSKDIEHSATSMTVNIQNDSLFKKLSAAEVLSLLPGVQVDENGGVKLQGESTSILMDGKPTRMSSSTLIMLLESMQGDQLKNIELINTPSAKYSGRTKKIIDINLKKQRDDGVLGSVSVRATNADFSVWPLATINYKTGKFIFTASTMPVLYSKRSTSSFFNRALLDNSLSFVEEQHQLRESNSNYYQFGIDYTINEKHSLSAGISSNVGIVESTTDLESDQFAFETLTDQQFNHNYSESRDNAYTLDLGYRYDIGDKGSRLDFASSYGEKKMDHSNLNKNELIDIINTTSTSNSNRDNQDQDHLKYSSRLDFAMPLKDKKGKFEAGMKYDDLKITDANLFEKLNTDSGSFEVDPNFTNAFDYNEQVFTAYTSFDSDFKKLKYSLGLRLEHVETKSFSETVGQKFNNTYTNFLPVIALKYMTNKKQTSNIGLSYRKGYNLPPYVQLNPFETFINSNTIERGNPELTQSVYHLFRLSHTIKNKYFLSLNANFYHDLFHTAQILEDDITIISYQNLGNRYYYKADFSTTLSLYPWWRLNVNPMLRYSILKNGRVENEVFTWNAYLVNTFTFPNSFILNVTSIISNGESGGFDTPNNFVRINTNISLTKRFLKNKMAARIGISDLFGVSNKNESNYIIDNTSFSSRVVLQRPLINFNFSYRFSSGKKINQKSKKKSEVDSSRF